MKTILLFGAGKSATSLIDYLGSRGGENHWRLQVCDSDLALAVSKTKGFTAAEALSFNVADDEKRAEFISGADIVISMLPPALHFLVAKDCVRFSKNLLTASYLDDSIQSLKSDIEAQNLIFLGEMGLDPGIDHMSAMKMIHEIKETGGLITSFKSHCGGLVYPESDNNPWHYKITWNPANVVMAGSAGATYRLEGKTVHIPYSGIFSNPENKVEVPGFGPLSWYANRDSLAYIETYHLQEIRTFIRTTLRYPAYCRGWNKLVQMGLTSRDDAGQVKECKTFEDWFALKNGNRNRQDRDFFDPEFSEQVRWLGLNSKENLPAGLSGSAALLQFCMEKNLAMQPDDRDMIIMLHEIEYTLSGKNQVRRSCLIAKGDDPLHTAMAKTVGLPLGIAAKLILENKITAKGLQIPVIPGIYTPVLKELASCGIRFEESASSL